MKFIELTTPEGNIKINPNLVEFIQVRDTTTFISFNSGEVAVLETYDKVAELLIGPFSHKDPEVEDIGEIEDLTPSGEVSLNLGLLSTPESYNRIEIRRGGPYKQKTVFLPPLKDSYKYIIIQESPRLQVLAVVKK